MSAITLTLSDEVATLTFEELEIPLIEAVIENAVDVETLDKNVYTDFTGRKRQWSHKWDSLERDVYDDLKGFYDRQFTLYQYPLLSIPELGIVDVPVRMTLGQQNIFNQCADVQDVQASWRETRQMPVTS